MDSAKQIVVIGVSATVFIIVFKLAAASLADVPIIGQPMAELAGIL